MSAGDYELVPVTLRDHLEAETEGEITPAHAPRATTRRAFADLSTDELRDMASRTDGGRANWKDWTRDMLLAFHHNRHGRYIPE